MAVDFERIYKAVSDAEHGPTTKDDQRWIRTKHAPPKGSSAFGPVQITQGKAQDYAKRGFLSPESKEFYDRVMGPMQANMIKYGKEPNKPGYDPAYDYGGGGKFPRDKQEAYKKIALEMMARDMSQAKNDTVKFLESWRGVPQTKDPSYFKKFNESYSKK